MWCDVRRVVLVLCADVRLLPVFAVATRQFHDALPADVHVGALRETEFLIQSMIDEAASACDASGPCSVDAQLVLIHRARVEQMGWCFDISDG